MYLYNIEEEEVADEILDKYRTRDIGEDGSIYYTGCDKPIMATDLQRIITARLKEIIDYVDSTIQKSGFNGYLGRDLS